jgi:hypothetical protein
MPVSTGVTANQFRPAAALATQMSVQSDRSDPMRIGVSRKNRSNRLSKRNIPMRKSLPDMMFSDPERSRLSMLRTWVLDNKVTEIEMKELQFWNFSQLQPIAEKPWSTFMGRTISVPDMPIEAQKYLGIFDKRSVGAI